MWIKINWISNNLNTCVLHLKSTLDKFKTPFRQVNVEKSTAMFSYKNKKVPSLPFQYMQNFLWSQFCWAGGGFTNQIAYFPLCILMQYTYRYALIQSTLINLFKLYIQDLVWKLILRYCTGHLTAAFDSISCIFREYRKCRWIDGNVL